MKGEGDTMDWFSVQRDGKDVSPPLPGENYAERWLLNHQSSSIDWAIRYEGYGIVGRGRPTADELRDLTTLRTGQADDLKIAMRGLEVWVSRASVADGAPYDDQVTVKGLDGRNDWVVIEEYPG